MKYETIIHHELYPTSLGRRCKIEAESEKEANEKADKICTELQHGVKPRKRQGPLVHTPCQLAEQ